MNTIQIEHNLEELSCWSPKALITLGRSVLLWLREFSDFGIILLDRSLRVTCINRWIEKYAQKAEEELVGKDVADVFPDLGHGVLRGFLKDALDGKTTLISYGLHKYIIRVPTHPIFQQEQGTMCQADLICPLVEEGSVKGVLVKIEDVTERILKERELRSAIESLQQALKEVKTLKGLLPICASCKKIRNDKGYWEQLETYIMEHTDAQFTHGICPECMERLYPEIYKKMMAQKKEGGHEGPSGG